MSIPAEGTILAGKYRVTKLLGEGGMGLVAEAVHLQLDQKVAIKFLRNEALAHSSLVARFAREARSMTRIRSEHVARVIDVGTLETGAPYMVMEFLEGMDLEAKVAREGPLPVERSVDLVLQACEALAEAHTLGIIHRDLKPANLFLASRADGSDCVKVLDFGISKTRPGSSEPDVSLTQTSVLLGSPLYMAPEQMNSAKEVDVRTDVWALGAILFELLTGSPPFPADSILEIKLRMEQRRPLDIRALRDDAPEALRAVVLRCIEYDPADRYADLAELATALAPFAPDAKLSVDRIRRLLGPSAPEAVSLRASPLARTELAPTPPSAPVRRDSSISQLDSASAHVTPVVPAAAARGRLWVGLAAGATLLLIVAVMVTRAAGSAPTPVAAAASAPAPVPSAAAPDSPTAQTAAAPAASAEPVVSAVAAAPARTAQARPPGKKPRTAVPATEDKPPEPAPAAPAGTADLFNTRK
jgi:eukaryotic-like serine/threonine-protein kinase